jgi:4-amino-4-deoxy-L-arabinose transferase-like glycosyltransferase
LNNTTSLTPWQWTAAILIVGLAVILPRGLGLASFVSVDEPKWLQRSADFYLALSQGDLAGTFTREHPGVTITWAGLGGFLVRYPQYIDQTSGRMGDPAPLEQFFRAAGRNPLQVLAAGRAFVVVLVTLVLLAAFVEGVRLLGLWPALVGFLLIAFDPFYIGLSRLLHPSGLMSTLVLLSLLAYLAFVFRGRRWVDLFLSGVSAGLAWLSESPAFFLAPFILLLALIEAGRFLAKQSRFSLAGIWKTVWPVLAWMGMGAAVYILLWPAMWSNPTGTVQQVLGQANLYAQEGHASDVFFDGRIITTDERKAFTEHAGKFLYPASYLGRRFYSVNYLWRATPVVLLGLALLAPGLVLYWRRELDRALVWTVLALILFALSFTLFMSFGSKKFDRYLLPVFLPLDLAAGTGLFLGAGWVAKRVPNRWSGWVAGLLLGLAVLLQASLSIRTYPYYLSYYNPLLGGGGQAPQVMMVGWGEGLDQAARFLNAKPGAADLRVMAWYPVGSFSYFFTGDTLGSPPEWEMARQELQNVDYVVTYVNQWQRQLPFPEMLAALEQLAPERVILLNGIEYARIYDVRDFAFRK